MARIVPCPRPSFLYDFVRCDDWESLTLALAEINENAYTLVTVTQHEEVYTVFFRRPAGG